MDSPRKYQNERPFGEDLFDGKGHQQVAEAISKVLINDTSQHIIGVEGALGAGKSTVIKILEGLIENEGFKSVSFDADQYHTTLKPALIKTIEATLQPLIQKSQRKTLEHAVNEALGKRLEYTKTTTSKLSWSAVIFGFSLTAAILSLKPSITFILDWFKHRAVDAAEAVTQAVPNAPDIQSGLVSLSLLMSPIALYFICRRPNLGDLIKKNGVDTISEIIDVNREVGAIELKSAFKTFSTLIPQDKKILLIIDNIDRVSPELARELWSDIEIILSLGSERLRMLLPYSEEHLALALEKSTLDDKNRSGREFISKRIPVPFSAPPILTTGWRGRFSEYWLETLPEVEGEEGVKDLIELWTKKITPRYLKSLVNRIGAKIDSCPENINGCACSAYLMVVKDQEHELGFLLSDPALLEEDTATDSSYRKLAATHKILRKYCGDRETWAKQVAALHFQTAFEIAESELITEPIRSAFRTYDGPELVKLSPLLGFDVFIERQIKTTKGAELIKVFDAINDAEGGPEIVRRYLEHVNHEILDTKTLNYNYDEELIASYLALKNAGWPIDTELAFQYQQLASKEISSGWRDIYNTMERETSPSRWKDFHQRVVECYEYTKVTERVPSFVENATPAFMVNNLLPLSKKVSDWVSETRFEKQDIVQLIKEACRRYSILSKAEFPVTVSPEIDLIFPRILAKVKCGNFQHETLSIIDFIEYSVSHTESLATVNTLLPFSRSWHDPDIPTAMTNQLVELYNTKSADEVTNQEDLGGLVSLITAAFITALQPNASISLRNRTSTLAASWLKGQLSRYSNYEQSLPNYLAVCAFSKVIEWFKVDELTSLLSGGVATLIKENRIDVLSINSILTADYSFIKTNCSLSAADLLNCLDSVGDRPTEHEKWEVEAVKDILTEKPEHLYGSLLSYVDNEHYNQEDWKYRLGRAPKVAELISTDMQANSVKLQHDAALCLALKEIVELDTVYDSNFIKQMIKLISGNKLTGLKRSLKVRFFKSETSHFVRTRIIDYFGDIVSLPEIKGETAQKEATDLLEYLLQENSQHLSWLISSVQSWNLTSWPQEALEDLSEVIKDFDNSELNGLRVAIKNQSRKSA